MSDQIREKVPVTRQLGKTMQRLVVSQVKSIYVVLARRYESAGRRGVAYVHGAHRAHIAVAHITVVHMAVVHTSVVCVIHVGLLLLLESKICLLVLF